MQRCNNYNKRYGGINVGITQLQKDQPFFPCSLIFVYFIRLFNLQDMEYYIVRGFRKNRTKVHYSIMSSQKKSALSVMHFLCYDSIIAKKMYMLRGCENIAYDVMYIVAKAIENVKTRVLWTCSRQLHLNRNSFLKQSHTYALMQVLM